MTTVKKRRFPLISPLLFAGILVVMLPIFTFMTLDRLKKQKEFSTQRLLGKGISLIRTFEAGTRTGLFRMGWGAGRIQTMLFETSLQPDINYMMIISEDGKIFAHSDASMVGKIFHDIPDTGELDKDLSLFEHRVRQQKDNATVFEVYKRFVPVRMRFKGGHKRMHGMQMHERGGGFDTENMKRHGREWCRPYLQAFDGNMPEKAQHYIFAGLSMEREAADRRRLVKLTIWQGILFFLLGCTGIIALFAFQAYRAASESLSRVKTFSDNVIENMPSGLIVVNLDHEITSINKTAKDILGKDVHASLPKLLELITEGVRSGDVINQELNIQVAREREDGVVQEKIIKLDITASPVKESDSRIRGFLFLFKDLTQIKALEKQVETNRRLAAIGKFAAGVAHEIRNPLSSIKGFATYFGRRYSENPADSRTASIMVKEVERINKSITQLLEFSKPMDAEKREVDINELIHHSIQLVNHDMVQKSIETQVDVNMKTPLIRTDGDRLNQVLLNLYLNAIQAMEEKGRLDISVQEKEDGALMEIRVKDSGDGIDKESIEQIFDPYYTTRQKGTGLGLSIVHTIVENLGGSIKVESTKGEGSSFIITLPVK